MEQKTDFKKIGVLTSGGDAPGMNAAIRAVVRTAIHYGIEVVGIRNGYQGLINRMFIPMEPHTVSKIISQGGTMLKSARCLEFKLPECQQTAYNNLKEEGIDALVVIGGDGSFRGARELYNSFGLPVVGIPGTIDNDIYGTDMTIGYDTATNTAMEAIDKIRDTAESHNLLFFVEVMGRHSGFIAAQTGLATGAESILVPEEPIDINRLCHYLQHERRKNKTSGIILVAEGGSEGGAQEVAEKVKKILPEYDIRSTNLGHIQRGGSPTAMDRVLASMLGNKAVVALLGGISGQMVGYASGKIVYVPFDEACSKHNSIPHHLYEISNIISR